MNLINDGDFRSVIGGTFSIPSTVSTSWTAAGTTSISSVSRGTYAGNVYSEHSWLAVGPALPDAALQAVAALSITSPASGTAGAAYSASLQTTVPNGARLVSGRLFRLSFWVYSKSRRLNVRIGRNYGSGSATAADIVDDRVIGFTPGAWKYISYQVSVPTLAASADLRASDFLSIIVALDNVADSTAASHPVLMVETSTAAVPLTAVTGFNLELLNTPEYSQPYTPSASASQNITGAALLASANNFTNNQSITGAGTVAALTIKPTNIFNLTGTLSGTSGTATFTLSGGTFAGFKIGYNIVNGVDQYRIIKIIDSTHVQVFSRITQTYTNASGWIVYPNAVEYADITGSTVATIENDGSFAINTLKGGLDNSGAFYFNALLNTFALNAITDAENKTAFAMVVAVGNHDSSQPNIPLVISTAAPNNSLQVVSTGTVNAPTGFASQKGNTGAPTAISVTASPFTFTAPGAIGDGSSPVGPNIQVYIGGGVVTAVAKNGTTLASGLTLTALTTINLQAGETVTVTYSGTPTMKYSFF